MEKTGSVLVIIPAYNEAGSIRAVVQELGEVCPEADYLIVTDGSTDGTPEICEEEGYHYLRLPVNLGLAGCFQAGMKYAHAQGYGYAVQFDGDGQHRPEYIMPMQKKMQEGYDIVLGSRFLQAEAGESRMRGMRSLGSRLIRGAIRLTTGASVTDPTCGLRMYNRRMIDDFANRLNYAPEPDTISFLIKNGARAAEVAVTVRERESGQSYLRPVNAAKYMLKMLVSILLVQNFRV
ncbi:MAG: glycosyltransferase family 2 protein [Eubacteriales bacterium]|nr:glycosyltransferase family 2 protein [Eubacteriales bacterium]